MPEEREHRRSLSPAVEDYTKAIYHLQQQLGGPVGTAVLAERLRVRPASVSGMLRKLDDLGYLDYVRYYGVRLSSAGEFAALKAVLDDAYRGEFEVIVVWAIDRICREGIEELLKLIHELRDRHVSLVSIQEPWLNGTDATTELLAAIAAWVARQESERRSEMVKAGFGQSSG